MNFSYFTNNSQNLFFPFYFSLFTGTACSRAGIAGAHRQPHASHHILPGEGSRGTQAADGLQGDRGDSEAAGQGVERGGGLGCALCTPLQKQGQAQTQGTDFNSLLILSYSCFVTFLPRPVPSLDSNVVAFAINRFFFLIIVFAFFFAAMA
jgi:hypothetical protein